MITSKRSTWPLLKILVLLSSASGLTACGGSMPSAKGPINLPTLTAEVRKAHRPVTTPDRPLTQAETEGYWGRDRGSLLMCEAGKATVIDYYDLLAANLRE